MSETIEDLLRELIDQLVEEEEEEEICEDCGTRDESVRVEGNDEEKGERPFSLCASCSSKRREQAQRVFEDLQSLAEEVEQRLEAIENTERELDRWRDEQLKKNRLFWDEYRRQVENFSSSRIRSLQYDFSRREEMNERVIRRLKRAKSLSEHLHLFSSETLNEHFSPGLLDFLSSLHSSQHSEEEQLPRHLFEQLNEHSSLDRILLPTDLDDDIEQQIQL